MAEEGKEDLPQLKAKSDSQVEKEKWPLRARLAFRFDTWSDSLERSREEWVENFLEVRNQRNLRGFFLRQMSVIPKGYDENNYRGGQSISWFAERLLDSLSERLLPTADLNKPLKKSNES